MQRPLMLKAKSAEHGFTLVELAIVMIIIGLLIGGILKGQEMIGNARTSSSVAQLKGIDAAVNTFYEKYQAYPGDMLAANARIPNCTVAPCWGGHTPDGDTLIESGPDLGNGPSGTTEGGVVFIHLTVAQMLSGNVNPTAVWTAATALPQFNLGGNVRFGFSINDSPRALIAAGAPVLNGHYMTAGATAANNVTATGGVIPSASAANVDRKLDDGMPNTGTVMAAGSVGVNPGNCALGTALTDLYNEADNGKSCTLYVKALN